MICLVLSPEEKAQVEQARRTRPQIAERCHYVLLNAEGWSVPHIAQRLDRNEHTIRTWLKAYQTAGLPGLHNTPQPGRPATKGQEVTAQLEHLLVQSPSHFGYLEEGWTVDLIRHYLAQKTNDVMQCPRTCYTDLDDLICKTLPQMDLLGEQHTSRYRHPAITWHAPHRTDQR